MVVGPRLILGSGSPRRSDLLRSAGLTFEVEVAGVDEDLPEPQPGGASDRASLPWGERPEDAAAVLAERKASVVGSRFAGEDALVIGADTIVAAEGQLLGKPSGPEEARDMLRLLSGKRHQVVTGVCVWRCRDGRARTSWERTWVTLESLDAARIEAYVASGDWADKAGGYGIQGPAGAFVTQLEEGGRDNVVGLPVALTLQLLADQEG